MVRAELKQLLATEHPEISAREIERIVNSFFDVITAHLARGGRVEIRGFGSFTTRCLEACISRDPRNGEPVDVGARRVPRFKSGKYLQEMINIGPTE
ncbi:HU family DNA-binding protein [Sphingomonas sp. PAMC 26605]|uniref:HU family DNA-binding protein n=1 Tax=Sphingomonas sp. PAMC 26605 TaxID=1112214 RepID=UPI00026CDCCE|nr:HU family DNA-binding protein [Sphingomonas sp. PAMC 26605]